MPVLLLSPHTLVPLKCSIVSYFSLARIACFATVMLTIFSCLLSQPKTSSLWLSATHGRCFVYCMANGNNCYKCAGLDARAAAIVMRCVRNTVNTGRTVVCTIHQPSIDIFEAFDDLLLMKSGGYVTYHGTLGKNSCKLIAYFEVSLLLLYISAQKLYLLARLQLVAPCTSPRLCRQTLLHG